MQKKLAPCLTLPYVILADAEMLDNTTFNLIVNFERVLERRVPQADMNEWLCAVALDGGISEHAGNIAVLLVTSRTSNRLENFADANFSADNAEKNYSNNVGNFDVTMKHADCKTEKTFFEAMNSITASNRNLKLLVCVPDCEYVDRVADFVRQCRNNISILAMEPITGTGFSQEYLGYSLLYALKISANELRSDI